MDSPRHRPGRRLWVLFATVLTVGIVLVWTAGQVAGLLVHGSWPRVSLLGSVVELVRVLGGGEPDAGIPAGLFWFWLAVEVAGVAWLGLRVRRLRRGGRQRTWTPRPAAGEPAGAVSFEAAYSRAVRADRRSW